MTVEIRDAGLFHVSLDHGASTAARSGALKLASI
jgi:hypothetical protein